MQAIKCELCGSSDIMKQDGFFQCQNCKTKYSLEEAKKLFVVVKIDKSQDLENYMTLARRYFKEKNYTECEKYYDLALREAPNSWEANFFRAYCHGLITGEHDPENSLKIFSHATMTSLQLIREHTDEDAQPDAVKTIVKNVISFGENIIMCAIESSTTTSSGTDIIIYGISKFYQNIEKHLKENYSDQTITLSTIQQALYDLVQRYSLYGRSDRKVLLARLTKEIHG